MGCWPWNREQQGWPKTSLEHYGIVTPLFKNYEARFMKNDNVSINSPFIIYLVDDDWEDQEIFLDAISKIDFTVELKIFAGGEELIEALNTADKLPNLLFLDLYMPGMDGEECLVRLREEMAFNEVPIVIYSTEYDIDRIEHLFHLGASRYLRKPTAFDSLVKSLELTVSSVIRNSQGGISVINITY